MIPPQFLRDSNEWCTLAYLLKAAGGHSMIFLGDTLPGAGRVLDRYSLCAFCLRLAAGIISTSQALGSASHHMLAFQRGLHSSLTLHSHSSEGGYARQVLRMASYPPPTGLIAPLNSSVNGLPVFEYIQDRECCRWCLALLLQCSGLLSQVSIVRGSGVPKIFPGGQSSDDSRPCLIHDFMNEAYSHLEDVRRGIEVICDFVPTNVRDLHSCGQLFKANVSDAHLTGEFIMPFFHVEPSPLVEHRVISDYRVSAPDKVLDLPLFNDVDATLKRPDYMELSDRPPKGQVLRLLLNSFSSRYSGASYILSPVYNSSDGLGLLQPVLDFKSGRT